MSAWLALVLRDWSYLDPDRLSFVAQYAGLTGAIGALVFLWQRSGATLSVCFTTRDALWLAKGAVATLALSSLALSVLTRLDGLPRSVFVIHFLLLLAGLAAWRLVYRATLREDAGGSAGSLPHERENILVVGANRLGLLYSQIVDEFHKDRGQIVGFLDERPEICGRKLNGHPVVGLVADLEKVHTEYASHGIDIDRIVVAARRDEFPPETYERLIAFAADHALEIEHLAETYCFAVTGRPVSAQTDESGFDALARAIPAEPEPSLYWSAKRLFDIAIAGSALVFAAPLLALVAVLTVLDVGSPALFWQQRIGRNGSRFLIYKFRTLKAPIDADGRIRNEDERLSALGAFIRFARLDELPQLFNVLVGDMSLIGPRPLLPVDQPEDASARLSVRPGITGWAQVHGGRELSAEDKASLDEWYCANAGPRLDLLIIGRTLRTIVVGENVDHAAAKRALNIAQAARRLA